MFPFACAILIASVPVKSERFLDSQASRPVVQAVSAGYGKVALNVTAGGGGAPDGFAVLWMDELDFVANGSKWHASPHPAQGEAFFTGTPVFNAWGAPDYVLDDGETVTVEIGDLLDDTGVLTGWTDELEGGVRYVFAAYALGNPRVTPSDPTAAVLRQTRLGTCAHTRQNWLRHPEYWPVGSLFLGNRSYSMSQLLSILGHPRTQNALVVLARQLIAAKLNVANGADPTPIQSEITAADLAIGFLWIPPVGGDTLPPSAVWQLVQRLEDFNHGIFSSDPCDPTSVEASSWGAVKAGYR